MEFGGLKHGHAGEAEGEGGHDLSQSSAAEIAGHEAGDENGRGLGQNREEPQPDERQAEDAEGDVLHEGREGRIADVSPVEMAGVGEELEFVAMEAVMAVGEAVGECKCSRDGGQHGQVGPGGWKRYLLFR